MYVPLAVWYSPSITFVCEPKTPVRSIAAYPPNVASVKSLSTVTGVGVRLLEKIRKWQPVLSKVRSVPAQVAQVIALGWYAHVAARLPICSPVNAIAPIALALNVTTGKSRPAPALGPARKEAPA